MRLSELIPPDAETGAGLALRHRGRYLLMLAGRQHVAGDEATFCAGIGGHCEPGEPWLACAQREAREELGAEVSVEPARDTVYIARDHSVRPVTVDDEPRPLCIYELWNPPAAPWNRRGQGYIYYVVVYAATLADQIEPMPGDLDAILWLSPEQLARLAEATVTLQALIAEGAQVRSKAPLPGHWPVQPLGTARALALLWKAASHD